MKIPLVYPKIPENSDKFLGKCIAFEKIDGSNLHWFWDNGWIKFGTRRTQFDFTKSGISEFIIEHSELSNAPHQFNDLLRDKLTILILNKYANKSVIVFTEFYGPNSFAGAHTFQDAEEDTQQLILFDVAVNNKLLPPQQFIDDFCIPEIQTAKVIYTGKYNGQFTEDVKKGKYNVNEGVVCKGIVDNEVFMTKIKTNDYLRRLKQR